MGILLLVYIKRYSILWAIGLFLYTLFTIGLVITVIKAIARNTSGSDGVISNGSKIFVTENTAAFIFSQSGIENIIGTAQENMVAWNHPLQYNEIDKRLERISVGFGAKANRAKRGGFPCTGQ